MSRLVRKDNPAVGIAGTLERLSGVAGVSSPYRKADGTIGFEWAGGTEIWYDDAKTETRNGRPVYIDDNGEEVTEDNVTIEGDES